MRSPETVKNELLAKQRITIAAENLLEAVGLPLVLVYRDNHKTLHILESTQPLGDSLDFRFED